jgi:hypothetical protein
MRWDLRGREKSRASAELKGGGRRGGESELTFDLAGDDLCDLDKLQRVNLGLKVSDEPTQQPKRPVSLVHHAQLETATGTEAHRLKRSTWRGPVSGTLTKAVS